jgi:hypothetical protein
LMWATHQKEQHQLGVIAGGEKSPASPDGGRDFCEFSHRFCPPTLTTAAAPDADSAANSGGDNIQRWKSDRLGMSA